jgi:hypothetical protein
LLCGLRVDGGAILVDFRKLGASCPCPLTPTLIDGSIRTLRLACPTVNTFFRDLDRHSARVSPNFGCKNTVLWNTFKTNRATDSSVVMKLPERTKAFIELGKRIGSLTAGEIKELAARAGSENPWFTEESIALSLRGLSAMLDEDEVMKWIMRYQPEPEKSSTVGVAMAGNIPFVGFHDFLCVLISGHRLKAKLSSQDSVIFTFIFKTLLAIEPRFEASVSIEPRLKDTDAIIATGSDNTARYFEYYFRNIPHIIRKNRSSCAVLMGEETDDDLARLGVDVFSYFGLGCRNVSKIYAPEEFDFGRLIKSWEPYRHVVLHHKYANNYDYQKSILLINLAPFLDGEFVILKKDEALVSPIAVIYFETYADQADLKKKIDALGDKLQLVTSARGWFGGSIEFGKGQFPSVGDYADNVDTMKFLAAI